MLKSAAHIDFYKKYIAMIFFLCLGVLVTYMNVHYSKDWEGYRFWYSILEEESWPRFFNEFNFLREPLYKASSKWVSEFIGFTGFVFLATVTLLFMKLHFMEKIVGNVVVATFFYVCLYLLLFEGTVIRVAYATSFIILALYFLNRQRYLLALFFIFVASQIQFTTILFLLIFPFYFVRPLRVVVWIIFVLSPLIVAFNLSPFAVLESFIGAINPRYLEYNQSKLINQNSTGLYLYFIAFFAMLVLLAQMYLKENFASDRFARALHSVSMIGIIFMCAFHSHVAIGARIGELLLLPIVILLSWVSIDLYKNGRHVQQTGLISVMVAYFAARLFYLYPTMFA
jgi:hypothetical protein